MHLPLQTKVLAAAAMAFRATQIIALACAAAPAHAQGHPERFPVQAVQATIDDGSLRTVILMDDKASFLKYCPTGRVGFVQFEGAKTNPSGCWVAPGSEAHPKFIQFKYINIQTGELKAFLIDPARVERKIYESRTERILPLSSQPK